MLGVLAFLLASAFVRSGAATLIGWNAAAAGFVIPAFWIMVTSTEEDLRRRARVEDTDRYVLMSLVLAAVALSFAAIVFALKEAKPGPGRTPEPALILGLSVLTLVLSWLVVQCLYALRYAHRYFGDQGGDGAPDGGIQFPGGAPSSYQDFLYVSVCVGATCQVSDVNITSTKYRNLVTSQALVAFVFNTMVLALGINIIGNLMGQ